MSRYSVSSITDEILPPTAQRKGQKGSNHGRCGPCGPSSLSAACPRQTASRDRPEMRQVIGLHKKAKIRRIPDMPLRLTFHFMYRYPNITPKSMRRDSRSVFFGWRLFAVWDLRPFLPWPSPGRLWGRRSDAAPCARRLQGAQGERKGERAREGQRRRGPWPTRYLTVTRP